jgi:hypothetical protein
MRLAYLGAVAAAAVIAVGCGGDDDNGDSSDESGVAQTIADLSTASRNADGARICSSVFAAALEENVRRASKQSCAAEVKENLPKGGYDLKVDDLNVEGDNATVNVTVSPPDAVLVPGQTDDKVIIALAKEGGDWRIIRIADE